MLVTRPPVTGQASPEWIGLVLALVLLVGGLIAWLGAPSQIARLAQAIAGGVLPGDPERVRASPAVLARVAAVLSSADGARLRGVRAELSERDPPALADAILADALARLAVSTAPQSRRGAIYAPIEEGDDPFAPRTDADYDLEQPLGATRVHRVTATEAARALEGALSHGFEVGPFVLSLAAIVPGERLVRALGRSEQLARDTGSVLEGIDRLSVASTTVDATRRLGAGDAVPPGLREDDIFVSWPAERRFVRSGVLHRSLCPVALARYGMPSVRMPDRYVHVAVLRGSPEGLRVIAESLLVPTGRVDTNPCAQ